MPNGKRILYTLCNEYTWYERVLSILDLAIELHVDQWKFKDATYGCYLDVKKTSWEFPKVKKKKGITYPYTSFYRKLGHKI